MYPIPVSFLRLGCYRSLSWWEMPFSPLLCLDFSALISGWLYAPLTKVILAFCYQPAKKSTLNVFIYHKPLVLSWGWVLWLDLSENHCSVYSFFFVAQSKLSLWCYFSRKGQAVDSESDIYFSGGSCKTSCFQLWSVQTGMCPARFCKWCSRILRLLYMMLEIIFIFSYTADLYFTARFRS